MSSEYDPNLSDILAEEIQKQIDREIVEIARMAGKGWVYVKYSEGIGFIKHCEVKDWVEENIKGPNKLIHDRWWFADPNDRLLFMLRWSE